jgi:uncharacterized protein with HEPN domain
LTEHDDLLYLAHIDEAADRIQQSAAVQGWGALDADVDLRDATIYRLQTLTESTQRLSSAFKEQHPEIPWNRVAGFRNRMVHGYLEVDLKVISAIIERDLPPLAQCVRAELGLRLQRERDERERDTGRDIGF